jgi:hypothetical protein
MEAYPPTHTILFSSQFVSQLDCHFVRCRCHRGRNQEGILDAATDDRRRRHGYAALRLPPPPPTLTSTGGPVVSILHNVNAAAA